MDGLPSTPGPGRQGRFQPWVRTTPRPPAPVYVIRDYSLRTARGSLRRVFVSAGLIRSDDAAVDAHDLAVDPAAVRTSEEGDRRSDVGGLAKTLKRGQLGQTVDSLLRLPVQKQV